MPSFHMTLRGLCELLFDIGGKFAVKHNKNKTKGSRH